MPAKKKAAAPAATKVTTKVTDTAPAEPTSAERVKASSEGNRKAQDAASATLRAERQAEADQTAAAQSALIVRRKAVNPDPNGDIDQRMAAVLADHIAMGARPKG